MMTQRKLKLKFLPSFILMGTLVLGGSRSALGFPKKLALEVGAQITVFKDIKGTLTVTNPKLVKVSVQNKKIQLIGMKTGIAHLIVGKQSVPVSIYSAKLTEVLKEIPEKLKDSPGLEIDIQPKIIEVRGTLFRLSDWKTLQEIKNRYPKLFEVKAKILPTLIPGLKHAVELDFKRHSIVSAQLEIRNENIDVLSSAKTKEEKQAIKKISENWGLRNIDSSHNIELRPMVEIEIVIAEMKKTYARSLGLQLPGTYSATVLPASNLGSAAVNFDGITPELHALINEGSGKILATPRLLCRSGEVAHFVAGGEIPIKVHSMKMADVLWKKYGVILDITPLADLNDGISTKLVTEISLLDEAHKIDGIPALLTNRIETHFDLRGSKTIALSGLIKSEIGRSGTSTPLLSEIPLIGELFKSRDYKENRTELVIFVTPRVISPENPPVVTKLPHWNDEE